jgi:hypothetical protein
MWGTPPHPRQGRRAPAPHSASNETTLGKSSFGLKCLVHGLRPLQPLETVKVATTRLPQPLLRPPAVADHRARDTSRGMQTQRTAGSRWLVLRFRPKHDILAKQALRPRICHRSPGSAGIRSQATDRASLCKSTAVGHAPRSRTRAHRCRALVAVLTGLLGAERLHDVSAGLKMLHHAVE